MVRHRDAQPFIWGQVSLIQLYAEVTSLWVVPGCYTIDAQRRGVFGSPFYFFGEDIFWGQDRLDLLERVLAGATPAPSSPTHRR